jgi:hypothetical protein
MEECWIATQRLNLIPNAYGRYFSLLKFLKPPRVFKVPLSRVYVPQCSLKVSLRTLPKLYGAPQCIVYVPLRDDDVPKCQEIEPHCFVDRPPVVFRFLSEAVIDAKLDELKDPKYGEVLLMQRDTRGADAPALVGQSYPKFGMTRPAPKRARVEMPESLETTYPHGYPYGHLSDAQVARTKAFLSDNGGFKLAAVSVATHPFCRAMTCGCAAAFM